MAIVSSIPCFSCCGINSTLCCGNRNTWPEKLYATFIAPDCPCIDGFSVEMSFHDESPIFRYSTNWSTSILRPEQFTTCTGVVNSSFNPIINGCNIGALAVVMQIFCDTKNSNSLTMGASLTNYEQIVEPNRCDPLTLYSGYHGGSLAALNSGSVSSSSNSGFYFFDGPEFIWNCGGPIIFRYNNMFFPGAFSDNFVLGTTITIDECSPSFIDILVTE